MLKFVGHCSWSTEKEIYNLNIYIIKEEMFQIGDLYSPLKNLEKEE